MLNSKGKIEKIKDARCPDGHFFQCTDWYKDKKIEMSRTPPCREWGGSVPVAPGDHNFRSYRSRSIAEVRKAMRQEIDRALAQIEEKNGQRLLFAR